MMGYQHMRARESEYAAARRRNKITGNETGMEGPFERDKLVSSHVLVPRYIAKETADLLRRAGKDWQPEYIAAFIATVDKAIAATEPVPTMETVKMVSIPISVAQDILAYTDASFAWPPPGLDFLPAALDALSAAVIAAK